MARLENLAAVTGVLAGVGGLVHGVGELLKGNTCLSSLGFESWTQGRIASNLGGEPAVSVVPNLLLSGALTIVASLALAVWAARFLDRGHSGRVLAALAILLLLVGGGIGPPARRAAGGAHRVRTPDWASARSGRMLAPAWPVLFWVSVADAAFLVLGSLAIGLVLDLDVSSTFVSAFFLAIVTMPLATLAGMAHASRHLPREEAPQRNETHRSKGGVATTA